MGFRSHKTEEAEKIITNRCMGFERARLECSKNLVVHGTAAESR